tara:strand:- start:5178 stop:5618 length:441 start_codon:yes stop_codon:yes gene_type:complete
MIEYRIKKIAADISEIGDRFLIYEYIISMGNDLPEILPEDRTEDKLVRGCQNPLWLDHTYVNLFDGSKSNEQGDRLLFTAYSESQIVRGMVEIIFYIYRDESIESIKSSNSKCLDKLGIKSILTSRRLGGLESLIGHMRKIAHKYE